MRELPSGTVTFLFTDIEGSTRLLRELGGVYADALAEHRRLLRAVFRTHGGVEVDTQGDAFFVAFARASDALAAARDAQKSLASTRLRARIGLHTGEPLVTDEGYVGIDVHRAARICAAGHGGQTLVSQQTRELVDDHLRDLGEFRLKDLLEPQRLYQLGQNDFPPLRTLHQTNLPVQQTPLVGRVRELSEAGTLLRTHRLLTLLGPGGSGKTRLALQVAAEASDDFPDGVIWVPLSPLRDPELVEPAIAQAVGAKDSVNEYLANRQVLLLLDNAEQVIGASPRVAALLAACVKLHILVTSREPLRLAAEQRYIVEPLGDADAVSLFVERARAVDSTFTEDPAVAAICRRLDGLPLALELAAARVNVLAPAALLARLDRRLPLLTDGARDMPERQQTLRATIAWSCDLLSEEERLLFQRLAIFPASFDLAAAEAVCEADFATFSSLIDKCLVRRLGSGRFGMLEIVQEFASEHLTSPEHEELSHRHGEHFVAVAQALIGTDGRPVGEDSFEKLDEDLANLRVALAWTMSTNAADLALRLGTALSTLWTERGHYHDAGAWLREAPLEDRSVTVSVRAAALDAAGRLAFFVAADVDRAERFYTQSLALYRGLGNTGRVAVLLNRMGGVAWERGRMDEAVDHHRAALKVFEETGDEAGRVVTVHLIGEIARDRGHYDEAQLMLEKAVRLARTSHPAMLRHSIHSLGDLALDRGDYARATEYFVESLELTDARDSRSQVMCVAGIGSALAGLGRHWMAASAWGTVEAQERALGFRMLSGERQRYERWAAVARERLGDAGFSKAYGEGEALTLEEAVQFALAVEGPDGAADNN